MQTLPSNTGRRSPFRNVGSAPSLLIMIILIVYPLGTLLLQIGFPDVFSSQPDWKFSASNIQTVLHNRLDIEAVGNSFWIGCVAAIVSIVIGTITAFGGIMARGATKTLINTCIWIIFFAPSFIIASGWVMLLQTGGILQQLFNLPPNSFNWFFTPVGMFLVMGLRYFPFAHFAMTQAIQNVGPEYIRAARLLGASRTTVFFRIWLRLLTPALLAGATIAFAEGFGDFGLATVIAANMQIPLVSYQIYAALYQLPVDFTSAAALSLMVVIVTATAIILQFWWLNRKSYGTISGSSWNNDVASATSRRVVIGLALVIVVLGLVLPFGSTIIQSLWKNTNLGFVSGNWTWSNYVDGLSAGSAGLQALLRTAEYAVITSFIVMILGLYIGQQMTFTKSLVSRILNTITMATIAIPGVVLGVSYVFAWNASWLKPIHLLIYGTPACLALAYTAGHLPYAIRLQLSSMAQISPNLLTAAQILGAKKWFVMRTIVVPLILETVVSTFLIAFTGVMFELPFASLLYPSGAPPYSVVIEHLYAEFQWAPGSALTIVGMFVVLGSYVLGNLILRKTLGRGSMSGAWSAGTGQPSNQQVNEVDLSISVGS